MATSFIKSFMEAVNLAAAKAAKKAQDPQDPRVKKTRQPQAASNALWMRLPGKLWRSGQLVQK